MAVAAPGMVGLVVLGVLLFVYGAIAALSSRCGRRRNATAGGGRAEAVSTHDADDADDSDDSGDSGGRTT